MTPSVENETLSGLGVSFTPVDEFELSLADGEYTDEFTFEESTYHLSVAGSTIDTPKPRDDQTFGEAIAPGEDEIASHFRMNVLTNFHRFITCHPVIPS
jgi:hypothetical protein